MSTRPNDRGVLDSITELIEKQVADLSAVLIITAKADMSTEIKLDATGKVQKDLSFPGKLVALTRVGLDGDIVAMIPGESIDGLTREEIMRIHDKNVETGVNNWNNFVDGIVKIVRIAADLAGKTLPSSFSDAGKFVTITSPPAISARLDRK